MSSSNIDIVVQRLGSADTGMKALFHACAVTSAEDTVRGQQDANMKPDIDVKLKVEAASQLRDSLEHYTTGLIYPAFLKKLIPIFITILKGQPVFISTSSEQVCNLCCVFP
jgi:hypothetical protein